MPKSSEFDLNKIKGYYESFVHKSHKRSVLASAQEALSFLHNAGLLRTNPELLDNINSDSFINMLLKSGGAPKEMFRSESEVKSLAKTPEKLPALTLGRVLPCGLEVQHTCSQSFMPQCKSMSKIELTSC